MPVHRSIGTIDRRAIVVAGLLTALVACGAPTTNKPSANSTGDVPEKPSKAVTLNILDVAGNLQLTQPTIDDFVHQHADIVSKVTYSKAPAPELAGKIKAQQNANRVDIDLVLTGTDGLSAGQEQGLWLDLLPKDADRIPGMKEYLPPAQKMQELAGNRGVTVTYYPSGPLIEYLPAMVPAPPRTADELLAYVIASTTGWDINPRVLGTVPKEAMITPLKGFHWVTDAHYAAVPKGVSTDKQAAVLQLLQFMLTPERQAKSYDKGYFYPGRAIKGVDLSKAPQDSQDAITEYGRPEYDKLIADNPTEVPMDAKGLVAAFDKWDREVGGSKVKK